MQGKVCLVTGANRGIGRATAEGLARRGATVLMVCRNRDAGESARAEISAVTGNTNLELFVGDLAVPREVRRLIEAVKTSQSRLDVLINNAGIFSPRREVTADGIEATFAVNHLAAFMLVNGLMDLLRASAPARVVIVASEAHRRTTNHEDWLSTGRYGGRAAYNRSKLANVLFCHDLAHRTSGTGISVNCCHPGWVDTAVLEGMYQRWWLRWLWPFIRSVFTITPEKAAGSVLYLAQSSDVDGVTGAYFRNCRPAAPAVISRDPRIAARLWDLSLRLAGETSAAR